MNSIKVCEYSRSRSFHDDLILQDQASGERSQDQWSSGFVWPSYAPILSYVPLKTKFENLVCNIPQKVLKLEPSYLAHLLGLRSR